MIQNLKAKLAENKEGNAGAHSGDNNTNTIKMATNDVHATRLADDCIGAP